MADKIGPPPRDRRRAGLRAIVEAVAQAHPITAGLTRLYQDTHPPKSVADREAWEDSITDAVNEHSDQLGEKEIRFEGASAALIEGIAKGCPDGCALPHFEFDDALKMASPANAEEVEEALYLLQSLGLVHVTDRPNASHVAPTQSFYEAFDEQVMGWSTARDAARLAEIVLEAEGASAEELHQRTGWAPRRLNPALRWLADRLPDGHAYGEVHPDYVLYWVRCEPETKLHLKRIVQEHGRTPTEGV